MADIGSAYLTIFPSMDGFGAKLASELNGINVSAIGDRLGDQIGDGISDGMGRATKGRPVSAVACRLCREPPWASLPSSRGAA